MPGENLTYLFKTEAGNQYLFDASTSQVYLVNDTDLKVIEHYRNRKAIDREFLLSGDDSPEMRSSIDRVNQWIEKDEAFSPSFLDFDFFSEEEFARKMENTQQLTLEVTQKCNLRCKYCIYRDDFDGHRGHGNAHMPWSVAKRSIDHFTKKINSFYRVQSRLGSAALSFYGGEPLANFDLIERCVEYVSGKDTAETIRYNLTTNATLIDDRIVDFFIANEFGVMVSLDGPRDIHDRNRVFENQAGTFDTVMKSLERIFRKDRDYFRSNVSFNAIHTYETDMDRVFDFYEELFTRFDTRMSVRFDLDVTNKNYPESVIKDYYARFVKLRNEFIETNKREKDQGKATLRNHLLNECFGADFSKLKQRCYQSSHSIHCMGGTCVPGHRRIYVDIHGNFHMCEKIDNTFVIGDYRNGVDYQKARSIFRDFQNTILSQCRDCLLLQNCNVCMAAVGKKGRFVNNGICENNSNGLKRDLRDLYAILECNPKAFNQKARFDREMEEERLS